MPNAVKRLYLNLVDDPEGEELELRYDLKLVTDKESAADQDAEDKWFRVGAVLDLANSGPAIMKELAERRIIDQSGRSSGCTTCTRPCGC